MRGSISWEFNTESTIVCPPSVSKDGNIYVASEDSLLHALDADGRERWTYPTRNVIRNPPVVGNDGTVYVSALDGRLLVLTADGREKWHIESTYDNEAYAVALTREGTIYADFRGLTAFNSLGERLWAHKELVGIPLTGADGIFYIMAKNLLALNARQEVEWTYRVPFGWGWASPTAIGADGTVYGTITDGTHYALEAIRSDGTQNWYFSTDEWQSGAVIGMDGTIYFGTSSFV